MSLEDTLNSVVESIQDIAESQQKMLQCTKGNLIANLVYQANQIQCWRDFAKSEAEAKFFDDALQRHKMLAANYGFVLNELPIQNKSGEGEEGHF